VHFCTQQIPHKFLGLSVENCKIVVNLLVSLQCMVLDTNKTPQCKQNTVYLCEDHAPRTTSPQSHHPKLCLDELPVVSRTTCNGVVYVVMSGM
jgi:hypothetical protein